MAFRWPRIPGIRYKTRAYARRRAVSSWDFLRGASAADRALSDQPVSAQDQVAQPPYAERHVGAHDDPVGYAEDDVVAGLAAQEGDHEAVGDDPIDRIPVTDAVANSDQRFLSSNPTSEITVSGMKTMVSATQNARMTCTPYSLILSAPFWKPSRTASG